MTGVEYKLLHCQDPILYIIKKQMRHSPTQGKEIYNLYNIHFIELLLINFQGARAYLPKVNIGTFFNFR